MKKFLMIAAAGVVLGCAVAGASGMQPKGLKSLKSLVRMVNRTSYAVNSDGAKVVAKSSLPRTVKLINTREKDYTVPQSVDDTSKKIDTTKTVLCHLEYDDFGRLVKCVREASDETFYNGQVVSGLRDTVTFEYQADGRLIGVNVKGYDIEYGSSADVGVSVVRCEEGAKYVYSGDRLVSTEETYNNGSYWSDEKETVEWSSLFGVPAMKIKTVRNYNGRLRTYCKVFTLDEKNADGSLKRMVYSDSVGTDTYESLVEFDNIKWNKFSKMEDLMNVDMTATLLGFHDSETGAPLAVFTDYLNNDKNDLASFRIIILDEKENDTLNVVTSRSGKTLNFDMTAKNGDETNFSYVPTDDKGSFEFHVRYGGNGYLNMFKEVSQLPDCLNKLTAVPIMNFEDFELLQQGDNLLTEREQALFEFDDNGNVTKFTTKNSDYDGYVITQIAECSDFIGYTSVAEIENGASWTAVGGNGKIEVRGAGGKPVVVYAVSGRLVYAEASAEDASVAAQPGIYVVKVGNKCKKVAVK